MTVTHVLTVSSVQFHPEVVYFRATATWNPRVVTTKTATAQAFTIFSLAEIEELQIQVIFLNTEVGRFEAQ